MLFRSLRKARERGHILEGLTVALANIDAIIETIKSSANPAEARERLQAGEWVAGGVAALLEKAGSVSCMTRSPLLNHSGQKRISITVDRYRDQILKMS